MKVEVKKIGDKECLFQEDIAASSWEMDSADIKFVDTLHLDCWFRNRGAEIIVRGEVTTHRIITCSRCLAEVGQTVTQPFTLQYRINTLGEYLEVDSDIREEVLLNFPMKVLCKDNCRGICPHCGVNLNYSPCRCKNKN